MLALLLAMLTNPVHTAIKSAALLSNDTFVCSGFVVGARGRDELIATAGHCTKPMPTVVQFYDGDAGIVIRAYRSRHADVALLRIRAHKWHPRSPLLRYVQIGDPYFLIGYAAGDPWSYSELRSRNGNEVFGQKDNDPVLMFDGPSVYLGDSGAAIFDGEGNAVAVLDAVDDPDRPAVVFAVPIRYIIELLRGLP